MAVIKNSLATALHKNMHFCPSFPPKLYRYFLFQVRFFRKQIVSDGKHQSEWYNLIETFLRITLIRFCNGFIDRHEYLLTRFDLRQTNASSEEFIGPLKRLKGWKGFLLSTVYMFNFTSEKLPNLYKQTLWRFKMASEKQIKLDFRFPVKLFVLFVNCWSIFRTFLKTCQKFTC